MSILLLLYGIETPEADIVEPEPEPTPTPSPGFTPGGAMRRKRFPSVVWDDRRRKQKREEEELIISW